MIGKACMKHGGIGRSNKSECYDCWLLEVKDMDRRTRKQIIKFFKETLGPHMDPDIYKRSNEDLLEAYRSHKNEQNWDGVKNESEMSELRLRI